MASILDEIISAVVEELPERKRRVPPQKLEQELAQAPPAASFQDALRGPDIKLIAEVKRQAPSAGVLDAKVAVDELAALYERAGASCMSVLTNDRYFGGDLEDLRVARSSSSLPLLRKDFIVDAYQLLEARAYGASCVLLIAAVLSDERLQQLLGRAHALGLDALVEVHCGDELARALDCGATLVGVNQRDLKDFSIDRSLAARLLAAVPDDVVTVAESGLRSPDDVAALRDCGIDAVLVGTAFMKVSEREPLVQAFVHAGRSSH